MPDKPKTRFLAHKNAVKSHQTVVESDSFAQAADAAMLQMVAKLPDTDVPVVAASGYYKVLGARDFLIELQTIADTPTPPHSRTRSDNLTGNK